MAAWILVPCLNALRAELNLIAPARDKTSDGTIGDTAHQGRTSDHNDDEIGKVPIRDADNVHEVHAYDADVDLRTPGLTMEKVVQRILTRCRSGAERRLRYIIFNRRIWEASNGWRERVYSGDNPHDKHAHFSASYETRLEADTGPWGLADLAEDDMTKNEFMAWMTEWAKSGPGMTAIARAVLTVDGIILGPPGSLNADGTPNTHWSLASYAQWTYRTAVDTKAFADTAVKAIAALAGQDLVDEVALAGSVGTLVSERVIQALPADRDDVSPAELQAAIVAAIRELAAPTA